MNTWTSKGPLTILLCLALAACKIGPGEGGAQKTLPTQVLMLNGAAHLAAPEGYCIDTRSLKRAFALMARCDAMGAGAGNPGAPLGLITASFIAAGEGHPLPAAEEIAATAGAVRVNENVQSDGIVLLHAEGPAPLADLSPVHWRGAARAGDAMMAVAVYGPPGSATTGAEGKRLATELIKRTQALTDAHAQKSATGG
jgi:hypothetical protein